MKQYTWTEVMKIAEHAAERAMGFSPRTGPLPKDMKAEHVVKIAVDAAFWALKDAGHMVKQDQRDRNYIDRAATDAERRHNAWKRQTGARC
jgi:hypothetical protein